MIKASLNLAIITFILVIVMNDSVLLLSGETRCWSLIEFKGLLGSFCYLFWLSVHQCLKHPSPCEE